MVVNRVSITGLDHLLVEQADLNVVERRHLLQASDCRHRCFAVQHLAPDSVQVVSGNLGSSTLFGGNFESCSHES